MARAASSPGRLEHGPRVLTRGLGPIGATQLDVYTWI